MKQYKQASPQFINSHKTTFWNFILIYVFAQSFSVPLLNGYIIVQDWMGIIIYHFHVLRKLVSLSQFWHMHLIEVVTLYVNISQLYGNYGAEISSIHSHYITCSWNIDINYCLPLICRLHTGLVSNNKSQLCLSNKSRTRGCLGDSLGFCLLFPLPLLLSHLLFLLFSPLFLFFCLLLLQKISLHSFLIIRWRRYLS